MRQLALDIGLSPVPDFDSFIALGNEPAMQALLAAAPGGPPLYLWGPSGSGKTHLLRAVQARALRADQTVGWLDAATDPHSLQADVQWLLLDQAEGWTPEQQHAAFRAFVQAATQGTAIFAPVVVP